MHWKWIQTVNRYVDARLLMRLTLELYSISFRSHWIIGNRMRVNKSTKQTTTIYTYTLYSYTVTFFCVCFLFWLQPIFNWCLCYTLCKQSPRMHFTAKQTTRWNKKKKQMKKPSANKQYFMWLSICTFCIYRYTCFIRWSVYCSLVWLVFFLLTLSVSIFIQIAMASSFNG